MLRRAGGQLLQLLRPCSAASVTGALQQQTRSINFFDAPNGPAVKLQNIEDEWCAASELENFVMLMLLGHGPSALHIGMRELVAPLKLRVCVS